MRLGRATKAPGRAATAERAAADDPGRRLLGDLLVEHAGVTPAQVAEAMLVRADTGKRLGSVLVDLGVIDERQLTEALSAQLGLPVADLRARAAEPDAVALLSDSLARGLSAVPLRIAEDGSVEVVVSDVGATTLTDLERAVGRRVRLLLAPPGDVRRVIDGTYRALADIERQVAAFAAGRSRRSGSATAVEAPVVQVVDMLVTQALRDRASDVHIEPQDAQVRVRFRIDGALHDVVALPEAMGASIASRIKVLANMNIVERRRPQDGQIATTVDDRAIDIRVATTGTVFGEKVVLRLLDKSRPLFRLADLGMPPATEQRFSGLVRSPYGMVICAGPTGSGKTTTLYASVSEINGVERNITTIEDPVEYVFPSLNQIQINEQAGVTFAAGLRSILRQDPDVILVGEIRDAETAQIAIQSALTGHFVLSSLHSTDSVSALYRFLDMGIEPFLVASSVLAVVGQRLLRRTCPHCRVPHVLTAEEEAFYRQAGGSGRTRFWVGEGCNLCSQTGYLDRVGVYELLQLSQEMRALVVAPNPSHDDMRRLALDQGMRSMRQEAIRLVDEDVTTVAEVVRTIYTL
jgi:type IV pilus assembly protein PilB